MVTLILSTIIVTGPVEMNRILKWPPKATKREGTLVTGIAVLASPTPGKFTVDTKTQRDEMKSYIHIAIADVPSFAPRIVTDMLWTKVGFPRSPPAAVQSILGKLPEATRNTLPSATCIAVTPPPLG